MYSFKSKTAAACLNLYANTSVAPNDTFFLNALKTLFRLFKVFLDLYKCILRGAAKFVQSSWGNLSLFENYKGVSNIFPKILDAISDSSLRHIFESENFRFPFSTKIT